MNVIEMMARIVGRQVCYLGDAVYASFDGYQIWLHTSNGINITNNIALDPKIWDALTKYRDGIYEQAKSEKPDS